MENNPYAVPKARLEPEPLNTGPRANVNGPYGPYRKNGTLRAVIVMLLVLDAIYVIFSFGYLNYLDIQQYQNADYLLSDEPSQLDNMTELTDKVYGYFSILLNVLFCVWINRVCKNGWLLDPPKMSITPGWAVGYYFIPIASLWKPFVAMSQIRAASYGQGDSLRSTLGLWWAFWLLSIVLGVVTYTLYALSETQADYLSASKLTFVAGGVNVALTYFAIAVVNGITRSQDRKLTQY